MSGNTRDDDHKPYASTGVRKNTQHGIVYQLKVLMLFIWRGWKLKYHKFSLATEMDKAGKFRDLVFRYTEKVDGPESCLFLQAIHNLAGNEMIRSKDLRNEKKKDNDFGLQQFFESYRKIKEDPEFKDVKLKKFIIFTNMDFNKEDRKQNKQIEFEKVKESDKLLDLGIGNKAISPRYKLTINRDSGLWEILDKSEISLLVNILFDLVYKGSPLTLVDKLLKRYHIALVEEHVINQEGKKFSDDFIEGKADENPRMMKFREIFLRKGLKRYSKDQKSEEVVRQFWDKVRIIPLEYVPNFGNRPDPPVLIQLEEFTDELCRRMKQEGPSDVFIGPITSAAASVDDPRYFFTQNIIDLFGHMLILEGTRLKFHPQFLGETELSGNLGDLKKSLRGKFGDLDQYRFTMLKDFYDTVKELTPELHELPTIDKKYEDDIEEFGKNLIFAVDQPNEKELDKLITAEIGLTSPFNAESVSALFLKNVLNWFIEKGEPEQEGTWYSRKKAKKFFDYAQKQMGKISALPSGSSNEPKKEEGDEQKNNPAVKKEELD